MLYPSIDSLLEKVNSKYMLVTVAAKRARHMQDTGEYKMEKYQSYKNVGKSLEEIYNGKIIATDEEDVIDEDLYEDENAVNQNTENSEEE